MPSYSLLGVRYSCADLAPLAQWLVRAAGEGQRGYLCIANVHTAALSRVDRRFRAAQLGALATVPDGMPLIWSGRALGSPARRVYGPDLMWRTLDAGRAAGVRHFFLGGTDEVLRALRQRVDQELPGVALAGALAPPFLAADEPGWDRVWEQLEQARPQVTWVGLGAPKQELLMARMASRTPGLMLGVGQALAQNAGLIPRPPRWLQEHGLEWVYRLASEPGRLWRRYLLYNSLFLLAAPLEIALQRARARIGR